MLASILSILRAVWTAALSLSWSSWTLMSVFLLLAIELRYWFWKRNEKKFIRGVVGKMVKNVEEKLDPLDELKYHTERRMGLFKILRFIAQGLAILGLLVITGYKASNNASIGKPLRRSVREPRRNEYRANLFLPSRMHGGRIRVDGKVAHVVQRTRGIVSIVVERKATASKIVVVDSTGRNDCTTSVSVTEDGQDIWPCDTQTIARK